LTHTDKTNDDLFSTFVLSDRSTNNVHE